MDDVKNVALLGTMALALAALLWLQRAMPAATRPAPLTGESVVWAVDDGHRITADDGPPAAMSGDHPGAWGPGQAIDLFALPGETLAFQIAVSAGDHPIRAATVGITALDDSRVSFERFVVVELAMPERSGGRSPGESLGWTTGSEPPAPSAIPDPLVPISHAPQWADYPMHIAAHRHRVLWIDATVPPDVAPGVRHYRVVVEDEGSRVASMPLSIDVGSVVLPYRAARTMVYFEPDKLNARVGAADATGAMLRLLHRHRLSTITPIRATADVRQLRDALTGALFTPALGYRGPGEGVGADVVAIGAYGALGDPDEAKLAEVADILTELAALGIEDRPGTTDVFLYAEDERCDSPRVARWRQALRSSSSLRLRALRVGQTCSEPPSEQHVDIPMMHAGSFRAGDGGWIYNGELPHTGAFLSDAWPISLRANVWIQMYNGIGRWFYWHAAFWDDDNRGGHGPYDPLVSSETFHNSDGDHCNGDGVLVYPGRQPRPWRDLGIAGVVPSIRLKQWRRGIEDAGYIQLARARDRRAADALVAALVAGAFSATKVPAWPTHPEPWLIARRKLFDIIERAR